MSRVALVAVAAIVIIGVASGSAVPTPRSADATPLTVVLGKRVGPWRIGMAYVQAPNLIRSQRHPEQLGPGCVAGPQLAPQIDYYPGLRLSWYGETRPRLFLADAATTRSGDHTSRGLVIGKSTLAQAVRMYPKERLQRRPQQEYALGATLLTVYRRTGYETGEYLDLWFDVGGRLVAIQTGSGGC